MAPEIATEFTVLGTELTITVKAVVAGIIFARKNAKIERAPGSQSQAKLPAPRSAGLELRRGQHDDRAAGPTAARAQALEESEAVIAREGELPDG